MNARSKRLALESSGTRTFRRLTVRRSRGGMSASATEFARSTTGSLYLGRRSLSRNPTRKCRKWRPCGVQSTIFANFNRFSQLKNMRRTRSRQRACRQRPRSRHRRCRRPPMHHPRPRLWLTRLRRRPPRALTVWTCRTTHCRTRSSTNKIGSPIDHLTQKRRTISSPSTDTTL